MKRTDIGIAVAAISLAAVGCDQERKGPVAQPMVTKTSATTEVSELPTYPASVTSLPRLELGQAILMFMPKLEQPSLGWDFNADGPIAWITDGYQDDEHRNIVTREGLLRVNVLGSPTTVLHKIKHELVWHVRYSSSAPAKFGVESINLQAGETDDGGCFGTLYNGCSFDPRASMKAAQIQYSEVCKHKSGGDSVSIFRLVYPGRVPMLLKWSTSGGSGGESSWLEMALLQNPTAMFTCD